MKNDLAVCKLSRHSEKLKGRLQTVWHARNFQYSLKAFLAISKLSLEAVLMTNMAPKQHQKRHWRPPLRHHQIVSPSIWKTILSHYIPGNPFCQNALLFSLLVIIVLWSAHWNWSHPNDLPLTAFGLALLLKNDGIAGNPNGWVYVLLHFVKAFFMF